MHDPHSFPGLKNVRRRSAEISEHTSSPAVAGGGIMCLIEQAIYKSAGRVFLLLSR